MANLSLERLIFNPADANNSPNLGAYVRAGTDGDQISSTLVSGKEGLDVNIVNTSIVVTATDLDIRDLTHVSDSVKIGDGTDFLAVNADGSINVVLISDANDGIFAEDSVHASGDNGQHILAVRNDSSGSLTSASGDYGSLQLDAAGRMWVNDAPNISSKATAFVAGLLALPLPAASLANRKRMQIQNKGNASIYIGDALVTTLTGLEISKGGTESVEIGPNNLMYAISGSAAQDVRILEMA